MSEKSPSSHQKYTNFDGWYAAEQAKWSSGEFSEQHVIVVRDRRKKRLAEDTLRLSVQSGATETPAEAPTTLSTPAETAVVPEHTPKNPERNSYEGGWGFFNEGNSLNPTEYQVTGDDDVWVDGLLGEPYRGPRSKIDRKFPLSEERRRIASKGIREAIEAYWKLEPGAAGKNMRQMRNNLQATAEQTDEYHRVPNRIAYQDIATNRTNSRESLVDNIGDKATNLYLHFGRLTSQEASPDKLDAVMRVYTYSAPEYAGAIAAAVIKASQEQLDHNVHLKLIDATGSVPLGSGHVKDDNLIFYAQTHGELAVIAETLRRLTSEHPGWFDENSRVTDVARRTDIPAVALAEEPRQELFNSIEKLSFNGSRREVMETICDKVFDRFLNQDYIKAKYNTRPLLADKVLSQEYVSRDVEGRKKMHGALKRALHKAAKEESPQYGISTENFAMNARQHSNPSE